MKTCAGLKNVLNLAGKRELVDKKVFIWDVGSGADVYPALEQWQIQMWQLSARAVSNRTVGDVLRNTHTHTSCAQSIYAKAKEYC